MGARSLSTQCLCTRRLEEAPVNNTLSDAFQEPAVSNMSVAMVMAACLCSASQSWLFRALSFSYQRAAGLAVPRDTRVLPAGPGAGTGTGGAAATGLRGQECTPHPRVAWGPGKPPWGRAGAPAVPPLSCGFPSTGLVNKRGQVHFTWHFSRSKRV